MSKPADTQPKWARDAYENARQRDAVIAVMHRMKRACDKDSGEYETRDDDRATFCDGGAARLTWALEELRRALDLPCEWDGETT